MALPAEDPADRLLNLINRAEPRIRDALRNALFAARDAVTLDELARLIEAGDWQGVLDRAAQAGALSIAQEYAAVYVLSGTEGAKAIGEMLEVVVDFNQVNERAVRQMQAERLRFIREFTAGQREATRDALVDGITRGLNPRDQARNFRSSIGLTRRQLAAVQNYRRLLEAGSSEALSRQLHDDRFLPKGSKSRAAFLDGSKPLTRAQIDRMTDRYSERYVKYRAEVIGRTEALRAVHSGTDEAYRQAIDAGQVQASQLQRTWVTARDERVRSSHSSLNGVVRGIDETWSGFEGELRYPGDPDAPAAETVQCRCALATRVGNPT